MLPETYPEIHIYWKDDKKQAAEYAAAYRELRAGQIEKLQAEMAGIAVVSGMRHVVPVVPSDVAMAEVGVTLASFSYITDAYLPAIFMEERYFKNYRNTPDMLCTLYHELGHWYLKHQKKGGAWTCEMENAERMEAFEKGEVYWHEQEADAFACHYMGKKAMLEHLNALRRIARSKNADWSVTETERRYKLIESLSD